MAAIMKEACASPAGLQRGMCMKWRGSQSLLMVFVAGILLGLLVSVLYRQMFPGTKAAYHERHEGQAGRINPLLACDAAAEVLSDPELVSFRGQIVDYIQRRMDRNYASRVSVYFRELNDGQWFSIGDTEKFAPASLRKVPLLIAMLKQAEKDPALLDRRVSFDLTGDYNAAQNVKPSKMLVQGEHYTIRELLTRMIVYSDNNAFTLLTKYVDSNQFDLVYAKLRLLNPRFPADDEYLSVQTYESFFRVLFNASYLSREMSEWALDLLTRTDFRAGLVAGVPSGIDVAHKFGEKSDAQGGTVQLHDCGIVYYPRRPYLLCVMSQGKDFQYLDDVISEISRLTFSEVDRQSRQRRK